MGFLDEFMNGFMGRPTEALRVPTDQRLSPEVIRQAADDPDWRAGYVTFTTRADGPEYAERLVNVAPPGEADVLFHLKDNDGNVTSVDVDSLAGGQWGLDGDGWGAIGFGPAGILAAGIGHAIDQSTKSWRFEGVTTNRDRITVITRRSPDQSTLLRLEARVA